MTKTKNTFLFCCFVSIWRDTEHTQSQPRERNQKGETALHTASIKNEMDTVRKLLDAGENPNVTDFAGKLYNSQISYGWDKIAIRWLDAFFVFLFKSIKKNTNSNLPQKRNIHT